MPVTPGRYTLSVSLALTLPEGISPRLHCKPAAGYKKKTAQLPQPNRQPLFLVAVQSKKPFKVKAGQQIERNIRTDCDPKAIITQLPPLNIP
jgi:hypothetical protein